MAPYVRKYRDPWAKRDMWRKHPVFTNAFYIRHAWPGFLWGIGAFAVYVGFDKLIQPDNVEKLKQEAREMRGGPVAH